MQAGNNPKWSDPSKICLAALHKKYNPMNNGLAATLSFGAT
jgi:hypothetical protein